MGRHLWVEGSNDAHVLAAVLEEAGFALHAGRSLCASPDACRAEALHVRVTRTPGWPGIRNQILALPQNDGDRIGFVFDMDSSAHLQRPWPAIRDALQDTFPSEAIPDLPPRDGWRGSATSALQVGFWAMPHGEQEGALEDFLWAGVPQEEPLRDVVVEAVARAEALHLQAGRLCGVGEQGRLVAAWRPKARVRGWLSLQPVPEVLLGKAWKEGLFAHGTEVERAFLAWARALFAGPSPD